jgi:predicted nucleic-acid-binding protein
MIAADTNVVVRFLTKDDPAQAARAAAVLSGRLVWISKTVMLEAAWVLLSLYGFEATKVIHALRSFAGLPNVRLEEPMQVAKAFEWATQGLDFAGALHLASSANTSRLLTFDHKFARRASKVTGQRVVPL